MKLLLANEEQKLARDRVTHGAWGTGLTLEQYLEREQLLRAHAWPKAAMQTWLLEDGGEVKASCETFRNDSFVDGTPGNSWSIASVFTEARLRGKGHALTLMNEVRDRLQREPKAQSVVLFSEVGANLYERAGYQVVAPAVDHVLPAVSGPAPAGVKPLRTSLPRPAAPTGPGLWLWPSVEQIDWHLARSHIYARFMGRQPLPYDAAELDGARVWWQAYFKTNELLVLWLEGPRQGIAGLLAAAQSLAHASGLKQVRLWADPLLALPEPKQVVPRTDELPMVCTFGNAHAWKNVQRALWV
ncbi:MAG: GNAT family N-acetyltransferase [Myxococcaceae bacterium]